MSVRSCIKPYIHRLFPCGVCPCSLLTRHTDNEPLICLVAVSIMLYPLNKTKVRYLCGAPQANKSTRHKGTADGYRALYGNTGKTYYVQLLLV